MESSRSPAELSGRFPVADNPASGIHAKSGFARERQQRAARAVENKNGYASSNRGEKILIELNHVGRNFGDIAAVSDVSFVIQPGEIVGLLGHNGAGKTTLMKMITGFLEPSTGSISIDGQLVAGGVHARLRNIGYLPENLPLYPEMRVIDYLEYVAGLRGVSQDQRNRQIASAIDRTELHDRVLQQIGTLSRGFRQRVGVAQALLNNPDILILDEPTNGLDPSQTQHMRDLILSIGKEATVIVSTHIMQEVKAICDRAIILRQGKLALDTRLADLEGGNEVNVRTDAGEEQLRSALPMAAVESLYLDSSADGVNSYRLQIQEGKALDEAIAVITRQLVEQQINVFGVDRNQLELETVFRDISEGLEVKTREVAHAV
jgi:ABC-2 type transport system ATP-binding protein